MRLCSICGRSSCRCGETVRNRACSKHGATLKIVSIAQVSPRGTKWFEAAKCSVAGCPTVRNFDKKREQKIIDRLKRKFGAEVRAEIYFHDQEQTSGPLSSQSLPSNPKVQKSSPQRSSRK